MSRRRASDGSGALGEGRRISPARDEVFRQLLDTKPRDPKTAAPVAEDDSQTPGAATTGGGAARRSVGSLGELRTLNRLRVVDALRREGSASRSELARLTGLSRTTVTTLVAELEGQGLVVEDAARAPHEASGRGRPPTLLRLDPGAGAAVGVDFGHRHLRVAVADLASTVLAERAIALDVDHGREAALDAARSLVDEALDEAGIERERVIGVGAGLPGPIDRRTGRIASATILADWSGTQPGVELAARLGLPVELDNDANLGALGELDLRGGAQSLLARLRQALLGHRRRPHPRRPPRARRDRIRGRARPRAGPAGRGRLPLRQPRLPRDRRLGGCAARLPAARLAGRADARVDARDCSRRATPERAASWRTPARRSERRSQRSATL